MFPQQQRRRPYLSPLPKVLSFLGESRCRVCPSFGTFGATISARVQGGFYGALTSRGENQVWCRLQEGCCAVWGPGERPPLTSCQGSQPHIWMQDWRL